MPVTHLVCVVVGAPGPVQGAAAAPLAVSITTPNTAGAIATESPASNLDRIDIDFLLVDDATDNGVHWQ
jgi:hypothetical protein